MDLTEDEAHALALADNKLGEVALWDDATLTSVLEELRTNEVDISDIGWSPDELDALFDAQGESAPPEDDPPPVEPGDPVSALGEVYELGPHRLACGSCVDSSVWSQLLDGDVPCLVLTDPPYGIGLDYSSHDDSEDAVSDLARQWLPIARALAPAVVLSSGVTRAWSYPEPDWVMCWFYGGGLHRSPWGFNCWLPLLSYGKDPSLANGKGARPDAVNLNTPSNSAHIDHPCPKPLALWSWLLERLVFTRCGVVVDPFAGSGTTLMVCAAMGHHARLIEVDPLYCDVIRRRWTQYARANDLDPGPGALD